MEVENIKIGDRFIFKRDPARPKAIIVDLPKDENGIIHFQCKDYNTDDNPYVILIKEKTLFEIKEIEKYYLEKWGEVKNTYCDIINCNNQKIIKWLGDRCKISNVNSKYFGLYKFEFNKVNLSTWFEFYPCILN